MIKWMEFNHAIKIKKKHEPDHRKVTFIEITMKRELIRMWLELMLLISMKFNFTRSYQLPKVFYLKCHELLFRTIFWPNLAEAQNWCLSHDIERHDRLNSFWMCDELGEIGFLNVHDVLSKEHRTLKNSYFESLMP